MADEIQPQRLPHQAPTEPVPEPEKPWNVKLAEDFVDQVRPAHDRIAGVMPSGFSIEASALRAHVAELITNVRAPFVEDAKAFDKDRLEWQKRYQALDARRQQLESELQTTRGSLESLKARLEGRVAELEGQLQAQAETKKPAPAADKSKK